MSNHFIELSPLDGRYFEQTQSLRQIFSEEALTRYRLDIEIKYLLDILIKLNPDIKEHEEWNTFINICESLSTINDVDLYAIKQIESITRHDVKSVEYFIKNYINSSELSQEFKICVTRFIHFGLTSQDINTLALWLQLKDFDTTYKKHIASIEIFLIDFFNKYKTMTMLSRTHGQPASPTTIGKEFAVFYERLSSQRMNNTFDVHINNNGGVKFGGCIGNFNAHYAAYPDIDWMEFADTFLLNRFGFKRSKYTTQIDHYDGMASYFDYIRRTNNILIDMCRDIWSYISNDYLKLSIINTEVGSSTMPHKVNPIDFENAEGNLILSNSLLDTFSNKLPISRLQRDLTDSTVTRNFGSAFGYAFIAYKNILKGLGKIEPNVDAINNDLNNNYVVLAEAIQSILKKEGIDNGYEILKEFSRKHTKPNQNDIIEFINSLNVDENIKSYMISLTPYNYIGKFPLNIN